MGNVVSLGKKVPKKVRKSVGVGVAIWMGQPFVTVISGNNSGLMPVQVVFHHLFGGGK